LAHLLEIAGDCLSLFCHQDPHRSFHVWDSVAPLCARCTGIYSALFLCLVTAFISTKLRRDIHPTNSPPWLSAGLWLLTGLGLALAEHMGWIELSLLERLLAGACLGISFYLFWTPAFVHTSSFSSRLSVSKVAVAVCCVMAFVTLWPWAPEAFTPLSVLGVIVTGVALVSLVVVRKRP